MGTSPKTIFLLALAFCFLSLRAKAGDIPEADVFHVEGLVYCDTCRAQFITKASYYLEGAVVDLECYSRKKDTTTFSAEATTDDRGNYKIEVIGDHQNDLCKISLVKSSQANCSELAEDEDHQMRKATVSMAKDSGITSNKRTVSPLGFMAKKPLPECPADLKQLGLAPPGAAT